MIRAKTAVVFFCLIEKNDVERKEKQNRLFFWLCVRSNAVGRCVNVLVGSCRFGTFRINFTIQNGKSFRMDACCMRLSTWALISHCQELWFRQISPSIIWYRAEIDSLHKSNAISYSVRFSLQTFCIFESLSVELFALFVCRFLCAARCCLSFEESPKMEQERFFFSIEHV